MKRYGRYAYKPEINARVAGSDAQLASAAKAAVAKRERQARERQRQQDAVAALVAGPEFAYVPGCFYIVRCACDCEHYVDTRRVPRIVDRDHAETFGAAINAAWTAYQWGAGATVERVVPA